MNANAVFELEEAGPSHFSQYGKAFQEKIFQGLITDIDWAKQMSEVMKPHFFDLKYIQYLTDRKRAIGMGSSKSGTEHLWSMALSASALLLLVPLFL